MRMAPEGSPDRLQAKEDERLALEGLRRQFGVVDQQTIDWLVDRRVSS
jgi:hypothetical protein